MPTYLVTGANRGLGLEFARQLSRRGDRVIATARNPKDAPELNGLDVRVEPLDVTDDASIARLATTLAGEPIDVLINNAGVGQTTDTLADLTAMELLRVFHANAVGPMMVAKALLPNVRAGGRRLIVSLSSVMGSIASTSSGGSYAYRASKAALNMLNRTMAIELEDVTCIVLHPGWVKTDMGGAGARLEIPESIAGMLRVIDGLSQGDDGRYLDYQGNELPW
jgi:NAD(P)-dependent dehydrogenase (short-subunit alcohol dehydrogenase family)